MKTIEHTHKNFLLQVNGQGIAFTKDGKMEVLRIKNGIVSLQLGTIIHLPIIKIHGVHLRHEKIEGSYYTMIKAYNSFAEEIFDLGVEDQMELSNWCSILNDNQYFQPK